jgi:hypothetical protein
MKTMDQIIMNVKHKLNARQKQHALPVLNIVRRTLIAERKVFYGGTAMNLYLPKRNRFYHPTKDLPDFDVYSTSAKRFVTSLADKLIRVGFTQVEVRCALHPGTYKLAWDSMSILDVTDVSVTEMRRLRKHSKRTSAGILLCPLSLLKANSYLELASPDTAAYRWKKVYKRVRLLEKHTRAPSSSVSSTPRSVSFSVSDSFKNHVVTGIHAARHYLKRPPAGGDLNGEVQLLGVVPSFKDTTSTIFKETPGAYNGMTQVEVNIKDRWYPYIRVHDVSSQCVAFDPQQSKQGPRYASLFHVLYVGYMEDYAFGKTDIPIRALLRIVNKKRFFHSECVGTAPTIQNLKRAQSTWTYPS